MLGVVLIVLTILLVLPVTFMLLGAAVSFVFGWTLTDTAVADHPDSELIETNY